MIGYSKKNREIIGESVFDKNIKKPGLRFNPGLALTGVRTTGPRNENKNGSRRIFFCIEIKYIF